MRKSKRSPRNTRRQPVSKRPVVYLLITLVLIALVLFFLDRCGKKTPVPPPERPAVETPEKPGLPPETEEPERQKPLQEQYTSPPVSLPVVRPPKITGTGVVALIIDDMGSTVSQVRELMGIGVPLTFSVIPGLRQAREVAETAHGRGYEVMLHIPMEPRDYPRRRLESNGLLLSYGNGEIEERMRGLVEEVPHAVGANNHMGSRFTEEREKMKIVLEVLKENDMFFIDSMTTPKSVGLRLAREMGLKSTARSAPFLDNVQDVAAIKEQLAALARLAVKNGGAVGICHPHRATIQALKEELPVMKSGGIRFVYASAVVK